MTNDHHEDVEETGHAGHGTHHGHQFGRFSPFKAFWYFFLHPSGIGNRIVLKKAALRPGEVLLDVGSGPGSAVIDAVRDHGAGQGIGVEPSRILRVASTWRAVTRGAKGATRFVEGTAESIPLADASVDVVIAVNSMHHWENIDRALGEIARVLRSGGRFVVSEEDFSSPDHPKQGGPHREWPDVDFAHLETTLTSLGLDADTEGLTVDGTPLKALVATKR